MTTNSDLDQIVDGYLSRLEVALAELAPSRRQQLIESITDHISEARSTLSANSEVAVRDILDRVGQPADIAEEALADQSRSPELRARGTRRIIIAGVAIVLVALLVFFGTVLNSRPNNGISNNTINATTSTVLSIAVPNVIGMALTSAERELLAVNLAYEVTFSCTSNHVKSGTVAAQAPSAGSLVRVGSAVRLVTPPKSCH